MLFAEKFKAKINTNFLRFENYFFFIVLSFVKIVPIFNI